MAKEKLSKSERLEKGQVEAQAIIEIAGKPKEHVEKSLKEYIAKLKEDDNYELTEEFIDEAVEKEDMEGIYTTYADIKFWAKDIGKLVGFCYDYMPASIEIIEPEKSIIKMKTITDMLNDMQARLHHTEMLTRNMLEENKSFNHTLNTLSKNLIMITLSKGKMDIGKLEKITGINEKFLKDILDKMVKDNVIEEENGQYTLITENGKNRK